jgi:hypothetical protein
MGDIANAGEAPRSGGEWTPFFKYLETDAKPTLERSRRRLATWRSAWRT